VVFSACVFLQFIFVIFRHYGDLSDLIAWILDLLLFICDRLCFIVKRGLMSASCIVCLLFG